MFVRKSNMSNPYTSMDTSTKNLSNTKKSKHIEIRCIKFQPETAFWTRLAHSIAALTTYDLYQIKLYKTNFEKTKQSNEMASTNMSIARGRREGSFPFSSFLFLSSLPLFLLAKQTTFQNLLPQINSFMNSFIKTARSVVSKTLFFCGASRKFLKT